MYGVTLYAEAGTALEWSQVGAGGRLSFTRRLSPSRTCYDVYGCALSATLVLVRSNADSAVTASKARRHAAAVPVRFSKLAPATDRTPVPVPVRCRYRGTTYVRTTAPPIALRELPSSHVQRTSARRWQERRSTRRLTAMPSGAPRSHAHTPPSRSTPSRPSPRRTPARASRRRRTRSRPAGGRSARRPSGATRG